MMLNHKLTSRCTCSKFIDSHLKPFRCKIEACAKQEFSSTACLLRHEREAHGMHGHGDRPHVCYYTGCERGAPGNGFPRRYNLHDHMKRVHDHKEEPSSGTASPDSRPAGRKRKASGPASAEPVARRQRTSAPLPSPPLGPQELEVPRVVRSMPARRHLPRRHVSHNDAWNGRPGSVARQQTDFMQSPPEQQVSTQRQQSGPESVHYPRNARHG